jgi:NitT/TauT family transport system permease protein
MSTLSSEYWLWDYGSNRRTIKWGIRLLSFAIFFGGWEIVGRTHRIFAIAPASAVMRRLVHDLAHGALWGPAAGTLKVAGLGYLLGAIVGLSVGSLIGMSRVGRATLDPLVNTGLATPMTLLIPVLGIYLGFGFRSKVFLVFMFCVFVVAVNTTAGIAETPGSLRETARAFGITEWGVYWKVVLPHAMPNILTGLRLAVGRAIQGAILADLLLEAGNLGGYLLRAGSTFDILGLLSGTFFTVLLGVGLMVLARLAERRALHWLRV